MVAGQKLVRLPREVDIFMRQRLREMLSLTDCDTLIIDLRKTRYIDATAIGEIVRARNLSVTEGKKVVVLVNKSSQILRVFRIVQLLDVLDIRVCNDRHIKCTSNRFVGRLGT